MQQKDQKDSIIYIKGGRKKNVALKLVFPLQGGIVTLVKALIRKTGILLFFMPKKVLENLTFPLVVQAHIFTEYCQL